MRLPHERYIQALLVDRLPKIEIRKCLVALDLCLPSKRDFARIIKSVMDVADPSLHKFLDSPKLTLSAARKKPYAELMIALKLTPYFKRPQYDFEQLTRVRAQLEYRTPMEGFIFSSISPEEAVTYMNGQFGFKLTKEDYLNYKAFFCDFTEMDSEGWNYHLLTAEPSEAKAKREIMQRQDDHDFVKWRLGFPAQIEYSSMLQKITVDAFYRYNKAIERENPNLQEANVLSMIMMRAGDRMKKHEPKGSGEGEESARVRLNEVRAMNQAAAPIHVGPLPDMAKAKAAAAQGGNVVALPVGRPTRADQEKDKEAKDGQKQGPAGGQRPDTGGVSNRRDGGGS